MELADLESHLLEKYPSLQVINKDKAYLHVWLPYSQKPLQFLALFHVIVTVEDNDQFKCRLFTYHGKELQEERVHTSGVEQGVVESSSLLSNVQNMGLCQGISRRKQLLSSDCHDFIHEPFGDKMVYRSLDCKYAVQVPRAMVGRGIAMSCSECSKFAAEVTELKQEPKGCTEQTTSETKCDNGKEEEEEKEEEVLCNPDIKELDNSELPCSDTDNDSDDSDAPLSHLKQKKKSDNVQEDDKHEVETELKEVKVKVEPEQEVFGDVADVMEVDVKEEEKPDVKKNLLARLPSSIQVVKSQQPSQRERLQGLSGITISAGVTSSSVTAAASRAASAKPRFRPGERARMVFNNGGAGQPRTLNFKQSFKKTSSSPATNHRPRIIDPGKKTNKSAAEPGIDMSAAKKHWKEVDSHRPKHGEPPNNCEICLRYFKVPNWRHMCLIRHKEALNINMKVTCPVCSQQNIPKLYLTAHFAEKHADLRASCCCECLEVIKMPDLKHGDELRKHILEKHHTAQSKEVCPHCGQVYSGKNTLNHHIKLKHEKKIAFICKICDKPFSKGGPYKAHMESRHGPKNLKCLKCEMAFPVVGKLKLHLVSHTSWSPYSCSECGFSQKLSKRVLGHIKRMHPNSTSAEVLTNESDLKEMMRIVNDEAEIIMMTSKSNSA